MQEENIAPFEASSAWLIAPSSYLMDRIVPDCEQIFLPAKSVPGGRLRMARGPLPEGEDMRGRMARLRRPARRHRAVAGEILYDMRHTAPQNWAHFLNQHLPVFFRVCAGAGLEPNKVLVALPENTPGYIRAAADLFGLRGLFCDDILEAEGLLCDLSPWMAIRATQHLWVDTPHVAQVLAQVDALADPAPDNVFLARRGTRNLENQAEIEAWLGARGFVTIYPEDLGAAAQIRLFRTARRIVAVHGAGQAPLLYAHPGGRLEQMVEILPCGHMTDVYRVMAQQIGCAWIGVRGKLKPAYVEPAYQAQNIFREFSLDSFELDPASLERAFEIAGL